MRVFVTGASGFIGAAVLPELTAAGHRVTGLARSDASAAAIEAAGAEAVRGDIEDLDVLKRAAAAADGVIHLAFQHDKAFSGRFADAVETDRRAIEAFGDALAGTGKPLLIASGTIATEAGRTATEHDHPEPAAGPGEGPAARIDNARLAIALADRGVRSAVVRLPIVHGEGDHGFLATLIGIARAKGASGHIGAGANRWSSVHRHDAALLFRLALEQAPAGSTLHAVSDEGVPLRVIAEVVGRHLDLPVVSVPAEDAAGHFGWLAAFLDADRPASNALTRELLGWEPTAPGLVEDLEKGHYFAAPAA
jgi:nucleoside-diphosphate-sugar epimerase